MTVVSSNGKNFASSEHTCRRGVQKCLSLYVTIKCFIYKSLYDMINSILGFDIRKIIELNKKAPADNYRLTYDDLFVLYIVYRMYETLDKNDQGFAFMPSMKIKQEIPLVDVEVEDIRVRLRKLWTFKLVETTTMVIMSEEAFLYIRMGENFNGILAHEPLE